VSLFGLGDVLVRPPTAGGRDVARTALVVGEDELTYGELTDRVLRVATGLHRRGFRKGDVVAIYLRNCAEYVELVFAVAHLGGVVVPLNYLLRATEVAFIVTDSEARWLVTETALLAGVESSVGPEFVVVVGAADQPGGDATHLPYPDLVEAEVQAPPASVRGSDRLLLQYTSGTTGFPKGAIHTHATVLFNALAQVVDFGITADDVHVVVPSLSWAAGLHCLTLSTIWRGGTIVLKPSGGFDADDLAGLVERHRVTTGMFAPSVLRMMLDSRVHERHDLSSLRLVLSGGEPVTPAVIGEFQRLVPGADVQQGYGVSEFPATALHLPEADVVSRGGATGWSSIAANVRVARPDGHDADIGEHGEIVLRSPATSLGYHGLASGATSAVVDGWLQTGDRGYVDADGVVHVSGRSKEMIVSGGLNIYPAEVERVLATFPGVVEVAVIGVPDRRYGEVGHAFVVCRTEDTLDQDALRQHAEQELAGFKVPRVWTVRTEALPRTVTGKLRRSELA
jgi:fatty-acyl-CoA synthase